MAKVIPHGSLWIQDSVVSLDPDQSVVKTEQGQTLTYDCLIVAPGIKLDWDRIRGLNETLGHHGVYSIYDKYSVTKLSRALKTFKGGNAIFTQPSTPIKCAGAPQKIMYCAEEIFCDSKIRSQSNVHFFSGMGKIFAIEKYAKALASVCERRDINVHLQHELVGVNGSKREAIFKSSDGSLMTMDYELLHVVPPMSPPDFIAQSQIGNAGGWVEVNQYTTQHVRFPNIFSLGDASSLPTSKTAAAVAAQSGITSGNVKSFLAGKELKLEYDGYTSCPLITGRGKLILAEFSGYSQQPQEVNDCRLYIVTRQTFAFDQSQERAMPYYLTADIIPTVYWKGMLTGFWHGPGILRPILNPQGK